MVNKIIYSVVLKTVVGKETVMCNIYSSKYMYIPYLRNRRGTNKIIVNKADIFPYILYSCFTMLFSLIG
jgi:hypothetical protein